MTWDQWRIIAKAADECFGAIDRRRKAERLLRLAKENFDRASAEFEDRESDYEHVVMDYAPQVTSQWVNFRSDNPAPKDESC